MFVFAWAITGFAVNSGSIQEPWTEIRLQFSLWVLLAAFEATTVINLFLELCCFYRLARQSKTQSLKDSHRFELYFVPTKNLTGT